MRSLANVSAFKLTLNHTVVFCE